MKIAIDFDGTCVTHEYPEVGKDIGAASVLKELVEKGHLLILYTMRSQENLVAAAKWFEKNGIDLYSINEDPGQKEWTSSPKAYAELYIDDVALGIPLTSEPQYSVRPFVNWIIVRSLLREKGIL